MARPISASTSSAMSRAASGSSSPRGGYGRHSLGEFRACAGVRLAGLPAAISASAPRRPTARPAGGGRPSVPHQRVQADRIGTGHGLDQRREQVFFLVLVVMDCGRLEIAQQAGRRALRAGVAAMLEQMPGQPAERGALTGDAAMTADSRARAGRVRAGAGPPGKLTAMAISQSCGPPLLSLVSRHHRRIESQARPANPACSTGSSASTGNCRAGLPSTMTRNSPTSACAAIGATSGSRAAPTPVRPWRPARSHTDRARSRPSGCRPGLSDFGHGHGLALGVERRY